jgi:hypothetical protein
MERKDKRVTIWEAYKILVKTFEDPKTLPALKKAAEDILRLLVSIMDLASNKGFTLLRWTKVVNVMIHKQPGIYLINKL